MTSHIAEPADPDTGTAGYSHLFVAGADPRVDVYDLETGTADVNPR